MPKSKHRKPSHHRKGRQRAAPSSFSAAETSGPSAACEIDPWPPSGEMPSEPVIPTIIEVGNAVAPDSTEADAETLERHTKAQNGTHFTGGDLTPRQLASLPVIAAASSNAEGARNAGIARRTLYRWLDDPDFRAELICLREEATALALSDLQAAMPIALSALIRCAQDDNPFVRYCAARYIYNTALHIGDSQNLQKQVQELQESLQSALQ